MSKNGLSSKQQLFVECYLTCLNATQAAIRAGYSRRSAASYGSELLDKPEIKAAIEARLAEAKAEADQVLALLTDHAYGTMGDFLIVNKKTGQATLSFTGAEDRLHLIRRFKQTRTTYTKEVEGKDTPMTEDVVEIELYDAQAAIVHLGRYNKLFTDNKVVSGDLTVLWKDALDDDDETGLGADQLPGAGEAA